MTKIELSPTELIEHFEEQLDLLKTHCQTFDSGKISIYKDIAVKLRLFFRETRNQKSLLKQLNLDHILFINSARTIDINNLMPAASLLIMNSEGISVSDISFQSSDKPNGIETVFISDSTPTSSGFIFSPCYDRHMTNENFEQWWEKQIILTDTKQNKFTRQDIVLFAADNFGGAHVAPEIKKPFYDITKNNSIGINNQVDVPNGEFLENRMTSLSFIGQDSISNENAINTPIPPSIRQIAEETIMTFDSRIRLYKENDILSISFIEKKTFRELQYQYDLELKPEMPNTFENFQKIIKDYFHSRRPDSPVVIYKELRDKKITLRRFVKCYVRNLEKFKNEEIALFGYSGDGWSLQGIVFKVVKKLKKF